MDRLVPGSTDQPYYYGRDQIGSIRRAFASTTSAPAYDYDSYGTALQSSIPVTSFGFAGMFYEPDSGLYLTQYRAYDPLVGRWLSRDPTGEAGDPANNLYAYVGGNPLGIIDPLGLCGGPFDRLLNALASNPLLLPLIIGTEIAGGGPEDPLADAAVLAEIAAAEATGATAEAAGAAAGGEGLGLTSGDAGAGSTAGDVPASTPIGRSGNPMGVTPGTNEPGSVAGRDYTGHAFDQMQGRGIMPSAVENTIQNGTPGPGNLPGRTTYHDPANNLTAVTDSASGRVITVRQGPQ